jgi:hypothetical protein
MKCGRYIFLSITLLIIPQTLVAVFLALQPLTSKRFSSLTATTDTPADLADGPEGREIFG